MDKLNIVGTTWIGFFIKFGGGVWCAKSTYIVSIRQLFHNIGESGPLPLCYREDSRTSHAIQGPATILFTKESDIRIKPKDKSLLSEFLEVNSLVFLLNKVGTLGKLLILWFWFQLAALLSTHICIWSIELLLIPIFCRILNSLSLATFEVNILY